MKLPLIHPPLVESPFYVDASVRLRELRDTSEDPLASEPVREACAGLLDHDKSFERWVDAEVIPVAPPGTFARILAELAPYEQAAALTLRRYRAGETESPFLACAAALRQQILRTMNETEVPR